ncbi:MAG TPA: ChaN family lipoprotein [Terriglobales bacterium]|nr:ChaN family lipoprotein [Terriglobales bacterium]
MRKRSSREWRRTAAQMHALASVRREIASQDAVVTSKYLDEFNQAFQRYDSVLSPDQLEQAIAQADILLIGDFHALPASQRFAAHLIEKCAQGRPIVLGVEAILARDQKLLDSWWRREIAAEELRQRLRFDREWGYPWEPFYELLCAARDHAEGIYGLDCLPREDLRRIRSRDRHAAAKICELRKHHPQAMVLVLFGESHVAPQHLPRAVRDVVPDAKLLTLLQNIDGLYWQATNEQCPALREGAVGAGKDAMCVFNSSPLEKCESYRLCLDRWHTENDEQQDFAPAIYNLIFSLARALGFRLDSPSNGTQPKYLTDSLPEVIHVRPDSASAALSDDKSCVYLAESNSFLLREFQIAAAAEECTRFLHFACRGMTASSPVARSLENALARFGSRLLSPEHNSADKTTAPADLLYEKYLAGSISQSAIRRMFLTHVETREQAESAMDRLNELTRA